MEDDTAELPEYSPTPGPPLTRTGRIHSSLEHRFVLQNKSGREWLSFKMKSRAVEQKHMPMFFDGDNIKGLVLLDLAKTETLKGLTVTIRAGTTVVGQEEERFLDKTEAIWTPASASESKVVGKHTYPFSISIPRDAMIVPGPKADPKLFLLPPTFSERASAAYIDYKLYVTVRRGGLRVNNRLSTSIVFLPRSVADPPSPLRVLVYAQGGPILGPDVDPEGWKVYDPVKIAGTLFNTRQVNVHCTLAIATPFTYPNNTAIPLLLTLRGTDVQALDLFAGAPNLQLLRTVAIGSEAADEHGVRRSNNTFALCVAKAVFWPHEAGSSAAANEFGREDVAGTETEMGTSDPEVRVLRGELFVPRGSKQSFAFPRFACRYSIAFLPPQVPGFIPATPSKESFLTQRVTITMVSAPGIVPVSQVPPGYEIPTDGDYNVATGFLENGNQRFLHHGR